MIIDKTWLHDDDLGPVVWPSGSEDGHTTDIGAERF